MLRLSAHYDLRKSRTFAIPSKKRLQPGLRPAQNQRVDVVGAFIGVDGFEVHHMADDAVFVRHAIAAVHVAEAQRNQECASPSPCNRVTLATISEDHWRCELFQCS